MYYEQAVKIKYYDCDCNNRLKLSAALQYMQQTSSEQMEVLGFSPAKLYTENMVFLLSKTCVKIHKMPICTQDVLVGTVAVTTKGVRFVREFVINSVEGERLVSALTLWVLVDIHSHRILRPSKFPYPLPFQPTMLGGAIADFAMPKLLESGERMRTSIPIQYSHLDINNHVNNSVYGDFVCDVLPYHQLIAQGLDTVVIDFQREAKWGETLEIITSPLSDLSYHISGQHAGAPCFEAFASLKAENDEALSVG